MIYNVEDTRRFFCDVKNAFVPISVSKYMRAENVTR